MLLKGPPWEVPWLEVPLLEELFETCLAGGTIDGCTLDGGTNAMFDGGTF
jgi:hypothetical protein